jgi:hypothetical protein
MSRYRQNGPGSYREVYDLTDYVAYWWVSSAEQVVGEPTLMLFVSVEWPTPGSF